MIPEEYRGKKFLLLAPRLRWTNGGDRRVTYSAERERDRETDKVIGEPVPIEFADDADVDVEYLLTRNPPWLALAKGRVGPVAVASTADKVGPEPTSADLPREGGG